MQIPQLTKYILDEIERGTPELAIKQKLFQSKWMPEEIEENYQYAMQEAQQLVSTYQSKKNISNTKLIVRIFAGIIGVGVICGIGVFVYLVVQSVQTPPSSDLVAFPTVSTSPKPSDAPLIAISNDADRLRERDRLQIKNALISYFEDQQKYPLRVSELSPTYLATVPRDPKTSNPYKYEQLSNGQDYKLCISFEEIGELCFNRLSN